MSVRDELIASLLLHHYVRADLIVRTTFTWFLIYRKHMFLYIYNVLSTRQQQPVVLPEGLIDNYNFDQIIMLRRVIIVINNLLGLISYHYAAFVTAAGHISLLLYPHPIRNVRINVCTPTHANICAPTHPGRFCSVLVMFLRHTKTNLQNS